MENNDVRFIHSLIICLCFMINLCSSQPQNIEIFYPGLIPSPEPSQPPLTPPPWSPSTPTSTPSPSSSYSNAKTIATAIGVTVAGTLVFAALFFFLLQKCVIAKRRKARVLDHNSNSNSNSNSNISLSPSSSSIDPRDHGNFNKFIVDHNGLDVVYWNDLQHQDHAHGYEVEEEEVIKTQESPLLHGQDSSIDISMYTEAVGNIGNSPPPPPPPPPAKKDASAPLPPPIPGKKGPAPPPPPPGKKGPGPPPPMPKKKSMSSESLNGESSSDGGQVKLKPLHWDKLNPTTANHSMVWDRVHKGSFSYDGDLMEALFGYVASNNKPTGNNDSATPRVTPNSPAQIVLLDSRKSQNIAIILKSLAISRNEILGALAEGKGLNADTLEKLTRISLTKEEETLILDFEGDPTRLADAESFHYHLLKAVPSASTRLRAMQFRFHYDSEILQLKQTLETLELACEELRKRGLFVKLLEAVLKAGNRMNAGTARGNAQAFNLNSLQKLSDVKSTDGKTTLLHFIVQEVIRSEGKRCVLNRNRSLGRNISKNRLSTDSPLPKEERDDEYIKLGLPLIGGLSSEFSNVKKAATIDYDGVIGTCTDLTKRISEIRELISQCSADGKGKFGLEMTSFLEAADEELRILKQEQTRVIDFVKNTTEYYQTGASKNPATQKLQLFVVVNHFLGLVDQVCIEITRNMQRRKASALKLGTSSPKSPPVRFENLPEHFMKKERTRSGSSSGSDSDS
ncbi:hypothetical protein ACFE04_024912 [Oxalis oulophora]